MPVTFSHLLVYGALATPLQRCIVHPKCMDELGYLSMGPDFTSLMYCNLVHILKMSNLTVRRIPYSDIDDVELQAICLNLPKIARLDISACFRTTTAGYRYFRLVGNYS